MSVIDILTRVDSICKKYDKYDIDKQRDANVSGDDAFARLYSVVESDIDAAIQKSQFASTEKNRAALVAINAEIRRTKARLLEEIPKLQRLAVKKVLPCQILGDLDTDATHHMTGNSQVLENFSSHHGSEKLQTSGKQTLPVAGDSSSLKVYTRRVPCSEGDALPAALVSQPLPPVQDLAVTSLDVQPPAVKGLSKEELATRSDLVLALSERIEAIPDGTGTGAKQTGGWTASASHMEIKIDSSDGKFESEFFQQTEESNNFRQEHEMRKKKQDQGLDVIAEGLDTLKNMAHDMNEELDRQVPLIDEIDTKVDRAAADLKNTNVRLKDTINQLRSSRNFCIDIILLCIILGIAAYLYNVLKK